MDQSEPPASQNQPPSKDAPSEPPSKKPKPDDAEDPIELSISDEVTWMYKVADSDELSGPYTSEQMLAWAEDGTFEGMEGGGAMCCKVGSEGTFYHTKRMDFELYT